MRGKFAEKKKTNFYTPGPGTYQHNEAKKNNFQFTMRPKPEIKSRNENPGPGNYESINQERWKDKAPRWSMPGRKDGGKPNTVTPGPGTYESQSQLRQTAAKIGTSKRSDKDLSKSPGPGTYEIKGITEENFAKRKGKSLSSRHKVINPMNNPGPGTYQESFSLVKNQAPSYKIGTEVRGKKKKNNNPGAGTYDPTFRSTKHSNPVWGIGTAPRPDLSQKLDNPGPGTYEIGSKNDSKISKLKTNFFLFFRFFAEFVLIFWIEPKYSLGLKLKKQKEITNVPGPGTYDPSTKLVKKDVELGKIGREKRSHKLSASKTPGPGSYQHQSQLGRISAKIGSQTRDNSRDKKNVPGPGSYLSKSIFDQPGRGKTIGMRLHPKNHRSDLGPGAYDPDYKLSKYSAPKIG